MEKAILVLDKMPDSCAYCRLLKSGLDNYCPIGELTPVDIWHKRDDNCPLRPLPQKQEVKMPNYVNDYEYERGWNDCLDEILGGR